MNRVRYPTRRARLEASIERAIEALNTLDGDPDLEHEPDDPAQAAPVHGQDMRRAADEDDEPSLASLTCVGSLHPASDGRQGFSQVSWAAGADDDREEERDGREPDVDQEAWRQPAHTPLVHVDSLHYGWSQGERVKRRRRRAP